MHIINSKASLAALARTADPPLRQLLLRRVGQLQADGERPFDVATFVIADLGDSASAIEQALGFSPVRSILDGLPWYHPDFTPAFEWLEHHAGWFELPFILSDDGFCHVLFVQDDDRTDADLIGMCRQEARRVGRIAQSLSQSKGLPDHI